MLRTQAIFFLGSRRIGLAMAFVLLSTACLGSGVQWPNSIDDVETATLFAALPAEAGESLVPLSKIFYDRITSRRFDSLATFEDPSVRQFFPTVANYSDYYAALVDALDRAHVRYNRPTDVQLLGIERAPSGSFLLSLRFQGRNDLPLRFWNTVLFRTDEWRWQDGRWWVVPGKI